MEEVEAEQDLEDQEARQEHLWGNSQGGKFLENPLYRDSILTLKDV